MQFEDRDVTYRVGPAEGMKPKTVLIEIEETCDHGSVTETTYVYVSPRGALLLASALEGVAGQPIKVKSRRKRAKK